MAEGGGDLLSLSVQKLDDELTCPVCQEHFKEPKVLPCLHYYCKKCVADLIGRARGKPFNCPECRREVQATNNDPESFPTAFFVNRMEDLYSVMKKAEPKEEVTCESCSEQTSVAFCQNCHEYICEGCVKAHKKLKNSPFASHVIVSIDSLRTSMTKSEAGRPPVVAQELTCSKHKNEPLKLYCYTCYQLVCRDCVLIDHSGHKYAFVVDVAPQCKSAIKEKATSLKNVSSGLKSALEALKDSEKKLLDHSTATTKAIDGAHDKVASKLQQKRKELKEKATKIINTSTGKVTAQEKNAQLAMGEVESLLEFLHRNLERATDQELLSLQKQMSDQADRMAQLYANPAAKFPVPRLPQLEVQCSGDVLQVLQDDFTVYDKDVSQAVQWKGTVQKLTSQLAMAQQQRADSEAALKENIKQNEAVIAKLKKEVAEVKQTQDIVQRQLATEKKQRSDNETTLRDTIKQKEEIITNITREKERVEKELQKIKRRNETVDETLVETLVDEYPDSNPPNQRLASQLPPARAQYASQPPYPDYAPDASQLPPYASQLASQLPPANQRLASQPPANQRPKDKPKDKNKPDYKRKS